MRGVTGGIVIFTISARFQLTRLMRGVTILPTLELTDKIEKFQLTRLMRGVTYDLYINVNADKFQLTRLMRGVTCNHSRL